MGVDKQWLKLGDRPILAWSLRAFGQCDAVHEIVVVTTDAARPRVSELLAQLKVRADIVQGGARRQDSAMAGLEAASDADWVVIHDAARPFVTTDLISRGLEAARETGAAIAAIPVTDTVKVVDGITIASTPPREQLWAAQTPQVFRRSLLVEAHRSHPETATDDAQLVERLGVAVRVFEGGYGNIKITTPLDLQLAEALVSSSTRDG